VYSMHANVSIHIHNLAHASRAGKCTRNRRSCK
jgi:hypothetical protein